MRTGWGIPLKVALGYAFFVLMLCMAVILVYRYTRAAYRISDIERDMSVRWTMSNRLVHRIFEIENIERAICLGDAGCWKEYDRAVDRAVAITDTLRTFLTDSLQHARIDSLQILLDKKRENTLRFVNVLSKKTDRRVYEETAEKLRNGKDSVMVSPKVRNKLEKEEVTYVVEKTGKNFLTRLADAFRRSKTDTTTVMVSTHSTASDSVQHIDIGDSVATVLMDIGHREDIRRKSRYNTVRELGRDLQLAGIELAGRMEQLLVSINEGEQQWLREAAEKDISARKEAVMKTGLLAVLAILAAVVSLFFIRRDNRRANRYRSELEEARARAEKLLVQRERLLLTITHDIKSPVASISGFIELLKEYIHDGKPKDYLDSIRSSARHLLRLVSTLLEYHSLEKGHVSIRAVDFFPAGILEECVRSFMPMAAEKGLLLEYNYTTDSAMSYHCDVFRIRQIADNLISNAIKYTKEGKVSVGAGVSDGCLTLTVADTGCGMTEEESHSVFNAFTRLSGAGGVEGVGLGLSITREIISLLGGTINLDTAPGNGSKFVVEIPVEESVAGGNTSGTADAEAEATETQSGTMRMLNIIVIDDDRLQLRLISEMLGKISGNVWNVDTCSGMEELDLLLTDNDYDILFTDIEMPGMSGFDIVRQIADKSLAVVAMTAHDTISDEYFADAGFAACLRKPFTIDSLVHVINDVAGTDNLAGDNSICSIDDRFETLTEFAAGDEAAERDILIQFYDDTMRHISILEKAAADGDKAAACNIAHKLLPVSTMINLSSVSLMQELSAARYTDNFSAEKLSDYCGIIIEELYDIASELRQKLNLK